MREVGEGGVFRHLSVRCLDDIDGRGYVCGCGVGGVVEEDNWLYFSIILLLHGIPLCVLLRRFCYCHCLFLAISGRNTLPV
jgi:hypothetical protein